MKGIFDAYALWPFDKDLIVWLKMLIRTRNFRVIKVRITDQLFGRLSFENKFSYEKNFPSFKF